MIQYITGDLIVAAKSAKDIVILVHCANNINVAGAGVIVPIFKEWPTAAQEYFNTSPQKLGDVSLSKTNNVIVCNLVGQDGVGLDKRRESPIRYWAIEKGFRKIRNIYDTYRTKGHKVKVIIPRMGVGLAGGKWPKVLTAINNGMPLSKYNLDVYTLDKETKKFPNTPLRDLV